MESLFSDDLIACPYCGEPVEISLDEGSSAQDLIEDCWVCCRPISIRATVGEEGEPVVSVHRLDD
jgi:hypothetical protein